MEAHVNAYINTASIANWRGVRIRHYFNTLIKKQGALQNGGRFHEFARGNARGGGLENYNKRHPPLSL